MRSSVPLLLGALALGMVGCMRESEPAPNVVVQRVDEIRTTAGSRLPASPLLRDSSWRSGFSLPVGESFEVAADARARELLFAIAAGAKAPLRFDVSVFEGGTWRSLFRETLPSGSLGWRIQRVGLPTEPGESRRLRFETTGEDGSGARAFWSAPIFLAPSTAADERPNVILISLDTLGASHLSAFGGVAGVSPHIDAFLDEGRSFQRAFAQFPNTLISHASLFSGLYPRRHGTYLGRRFPGPSLVERFAESGSRTVAITENGYVGGFFGFNRGFDAYADGPTRSIVDGGDAGDTFDEAARWLERFGIRDRFFLFVHTYEVHGPHAVRDAEAAALARRLSPHYVSGSQNAFSFMRIRQHNRGVVPFSKRELKLLRALYAAEVNYLDRVVGEFVDLLDRLGLGEKTLVVLTADHGEEFREHGKIGHGGTLYNRALQVPLGFRWTGTIEPGKPDMPVQLVDVMPTLLELAGLEIPASLDGRSLTPWISDDPEHPAQEPAFAELRGSRKNVGCPPGRPEEDCRSGRYSVQTRDFKLIASWHPPVQRLYDLRTDPLEIHDVVAENPEVRSALWAQLESYFDEPAARVPEIPLDPGLRERLEALGYVVE